MRRRRVHYELTVWPSLVQNAEGMVELMPYSERSSWWWGKDGGWRSDDHPDCLKRRCSTHQRLNTAVKAHKALRALNAQVQGRGFAVLTKIYWRKGKLYQQHTFVKDQPALFHKHPWFQQ